MNDTPSRDALFGLLAEYASPEALLQAARSMRDAGYRATDAFTPFPIEGLPEAIGRHRTAIPWIVLAGGLIGGGSAYALQYWVSAIAYPLNVGGRPLHSWPAFIPATFETTILLASLAGVVGMLWLCGLPRLHHPLFEVPRFQRASTDAFFLCIEARDDRFDQEATRALLIRFGAVEVWDVPKTD